MTSLCKSCTTLFAYVSLYDHFREILPHTPWAKKYVLLLFRCLLYVNPAPHSMHMSLKMTTSGKYCPALLATKKISSMFCQLCLQILHHTVCICLFKWFFSSLRYVLPYASSDDFPLQIMHDTLCICLLRWPLWGNTAPHSLQKKKISSMFCQLCLQIYSLCKSYTTLFAYVSLDDFPMEIFFLVCVAICVFRLLPYANPAPHSLQLNGFSSLCILVFGGNTDPHSFKKKGFYFSGMCCHIYLQMTSLC